MKAIVTQLPDERTMIVLLEDGSIIKKSMIQMSLLESGSL